MLVDKRGSVAQGNNSFAIQRMCSPAHWKTTKLVLKVIASLVLALGVTWCAGWMIRDAKTKLASGNWLVYVNGIPHRYGRGDVVMAYFSGIVCTLLSWVFLCSNCYSLVQNSESFQNRGEMD